MKKKEIEFRIFEHEYYSTKSEYRWECPELICQDLTDDAKSVKACKLRARAFARKVAPGRKVVFK